MVHLPRRLRSVALFRQLGPGLVTGAADDDPSGIATYSQAGAQFGYGLLWTMVLTYPLMSAVQLISAHIGRVTGCGLAKNMREVMPPWLVTGLVALLFLANTINIGADIAAMGAAAQLVVGGGDHLFTIGFALLTLALQMFVPYRSYARMLKWLTLVLLAYVALLFVVRVDWARAAHGLVWPGPAPAGPAITTVVAVFGTTISPYLFFWQSAQEVEGMAQRPREAPLTQDSRAARREFRRMRIDTLCGMAFSNLVALAIMVSAAATLNAAGKTDVDTAADAARALLPLAGPFAFVLFSLGVIGTGLLAVPVLAGSAAFAVGEAQGWRCGFDHPPRKAVGFYGVIAAATLTGLLIDWSPLDPIKALFWSAVINGVVAVPLMAAMMVVGSRKAQMGAFRNGPWLQGLGWTATAVMAAAAVAMLVWR